MLTNIDHETADVLGDFFKSVFVDEDRSTIPDFQQRTNECMTDIPFTEDMVRKKLHKNPPQQGTGPMYCIFRHIQDRSLRLEKAIVTPIFKGSRQKAGNYRPVSLTSTACKILEGIIRENTMAFLNKHKIINPNQQGFLEGKSCLTNLLETFEKWTTALDEGHGFYVIYLDYRKAFDRVPNYILYVNEIPDLAQ